MWGNAGKYKTRSGKKKFRGQKFGGGTFWGNFFRRSSGGKQQFLGGNFKKKKSPGGILWKMSKKNLGGIF